MMELSASIRDIHLSGFANGLPRSKSSTSLFSGFRKSNASMARRDDNNKRFSWFGNPVSHISSQLMASSSGSSRLSLTERPRSTVAAASSSSSSSPMSAGVHRRNNNNNNSASGTSCAAAQPGAQRTIVLIKTACRGVREAVSLTEHKMKAASSLNESDDADKAMIDTEKHLNKLLYYLGLMEEIYEAYVVEHRMREGVRAIGQAYVHSNGPERDAALSEVKLGFKDCSQQLSILEGQLESLIGVLHIQMKGLQGFARLCSGDVFEVHMKIGSQKWRTKGRIGRDGVQQWDSTVRTFNVPISHLLYIRVMEIRTLGKQVLLGNKYCETLDLLSTQPQLMTINLSLSLRLNLVVTWDPLAGLAKERNAAAMVIENRSKSVSSLSMRSSYVNKSVRLSRQPSSSLEELSDNGQDKDLDDEERHRDESPESERQQEREIPRRSSTQLVPDAGDAAQPTKMGVPSKSDDNFLLVRRNGNGSTVSSSPQTQPQPQPQQQQHWWQNKMYSSPTHTIDSGYDDSFRASSKRRIVLSPMGEMEHEYANASVNNWQSNVMMRKRHADDSDESRACSVLGGVQWPTGVDGHQQQQQRRNSDWTANKWRLGSVLSYLNSTIADIQGQYADLETFERSVASLYQRLLVQQEKTGALSLEVSDVMESFDFLESEDTDESSQYESLESDEPKTVFTPQLDETLLIHLSYCRHLVDGLGSYGPLKCREKQAVKKLQVQGRILSKLSKLIERWQNNPTTRLAVFEELHGLPHLQKLWEAACSGTRSLYVTAGAAVAKLSPLSDLAHVPRDRLEKVMQRLVARCQDVPKYEPQSHLTVFQFRYFVRSKERSFQVRVDEISGELETTEALDSGKHFVIQKTITRLSLVGLLPSASVLLRMSHFLLDLSDDRENPRVLVASYLRNTAKDNDLRQKLVDTFFEGLESDEALDRQGSCCALGVLKEDNAIEALAYLVQSDPSPRVRETAKRSLQHFGDRGQDTLQQLQLSSYGFQGVNIA